jgi:hypothetical protein
MVDRVRFGGGVKELDRFLKVLWSKLDSHGHLFPCSGLDHFKYKISLLLDPWSYNPNQTLRQMAMTDHSELVGDLSAGYYTCIQHVEFYLQEETKVYGDKDRQCVAVIPLMQGYIQHQQESVRAYANCLKPNWTQAGWNLQKNKEVLYDIAWAGLRNSLMNKVGLMLHAWGRFDTLDEFFDTAASSEVTHVENKNPQQQQH